MSPAPAFELLRFEATPVAPAAAVVEVEGVFTGPRPSRPRLLVESGGVAREMPALDAGGLPWIAAFAVPLSALQAPGTSFALVLDRGPLIALPSPTRSGGDDDDRFVRLGRTVNDLRHRLGEAEQELAAAAERVEAVSAERDGLATELAEARGELADAKAQAEQSHAAAIAAREAQAAAEGEADEARDALTRARAEAREEAADELEEARREAQNARIELAEAAEAARRDAEKASARLAEADQAKEGLQRAAAETRARLAEASERADAAEDDARQAERALALARARVQELERERRRAAPAAARARVATTAPSDAPRFAPSEGHDGVDDDPTGDDSDPRDEGGEGPGPGAIRVSRSGGTAEEGAAHPEEGWEDAPDRDEDEVEGPTEPELWADDDTDDTLPLPAVRPRTAAARRSPAPAPDEDDEGGGAVAATTGGPLTPAQRATELLHNPRVIVGGIFGLLLLAVLLIFIGIGPV